MHSFVFSGKTLHLSYLLTTSEVDQVQLPTQLLLCLHVFLFDAYQEDAVAAGTVLIHV